MTERDDDGLDLVTGPSGQSPADVGHRTWGASTLLAVCTAAAVVAAWGAIDWVFLVVARATPDITFFGAVEPPTSWLERDDAQRAAQRGVGVCLISGLAMHAGVTPDDPPAERVPGCAEHSGEPKTRPGG